MELNNLHYGVKAKHVTLLLNLGPKYLIQIA
jgi:hypothetical protein